MPDDRRPHDPYAPPPAASADEPSDEVGVESGGDVELSDSSDDGLEDMRRVDLVELAESESIAAYGTKADLIERIRKHRQS